MADIFSRIHQRLQQRERHSLTRKRRLLQSPQQARVVVDGQTCLAFCSNDYLGLANHPRLIEAFKQAADETGVGSGASHLVLGHHEYHQRLEERLADKVMRDKVLLFSTGYMANMGTINVLAERGDWVFQDKLNHASLLDGALLSAARFKRYRHKDLTHLKSLLNQSNEQGSSSFVHRLIVTDTVFSMDGDMAPLKELAELAGHYHATLMVDDAHGFGVLGSGGAGALSAVGLDQNQVPVLMATLGKALGTAGAFVAGDKDLIEYLLQSARPYIYTTAMPPAIAAATLAALEVLENEAWRLQHLQTLISHFKAGARKIGLNLLESDTAIQPVLTGSAELALVISERMRERGVWVTAIRPPTVPQGTARLRITLSAAHDFKDVDYLLQVLAEVFDGAEGVPSQ